MRSVALKVSSVVKHYGAVKALDGVSFEVYEGEYFAIIGPSGSGKSTLLKCIAGLEKPDKGDIIIFGRRVNELPPERRGVGLIFQEIHLFPHMTVRGNVLYPAVVRGVERASEAVRDVLSSLSVELKARNFPRELSLGEQQKVALARTLASQSKLVLMDEPYGSMDPRTAELLRYEVRRLAKSLGLTVIHVTHNQEEAMAVADRIAVMRRGRIEQIGEPVDLYLRPRSLFVARFVGGENNFLEGRVAGSKAPFTAIDVGSCLLWGWGEVNDEKAVLAIRPEKLRFAADGLLEGIVEAREFLGKTYKYLVKLDDGRVLIVKTRDKVEVGSRVRLSFNLEDAVVLPYPREGLEEAIRYE